MLALKARIDGQWKTIGMASSFKDPNGNDGFTCELISVPGSWNGRFIAVADDAEPEPQPTERKVYKPKPAKQEVSVVNTKDDRSYGEPSNPATDEEYEAGWRYCPRRRGGHIWNIYTAATGLIPSPKKRPEEYPDSKCSWHLPIGSKEDVEMPERRRLAKISAK